MTSERIESPLAKAWKRLKKNYPAMTSLFVILLAILLAIIAPVIAPDKTPDANDQVLEITNESPGFKIEMLMVRKNRPVRKSNLITTIIRGRDNAYSMVPTNNYRLEDRLVIVEVYRGERYAAILDTFDMVDVVHPLSIADYEPKQAGESISFSDFTDQKIETTIGELRAEIERNHLKTKTYRLGTDKFGRDILSRLLFGLRVSISVGFIAVFVSLLIGITLGSTAGYFRNDKIKISKASVAALVVTLILAIVRAIVFPEIKIPRDGIAAYYNTAVVFVMTFFLVATYILNFKRTSFLIQIFPERIGNIVWALLLWILFAFVMIQGDWKICEDGAAAFINRSYYVILAFICFRMLFKRLFQFMRSKLFFPYDDAAMLVINVVWSIPTILLAMALSFSLKTWLESFWVIYLAVGLSMWVEVARIVRGQVMIVREMEYVQAARSLGFDNARIIGRHILPNIIGPIMVIMAANFAAAILIEAGLSFIGIGVQPPKPSWGIMLSENRNYLKVVGKAFLALAPGFSIMILVLAFNLLGNGLRDAFDVKGKES